MNRFLLIFLLALSACSPSRPTTADSPKTIANIPPSTLSPQRPQNPQSPLSSITQTPQHPTQSTTHIPRPAQEKAQLTYHHTSRNGIVLSLVSFDDRDFELQVADQSHGPATHWNDAQDAGKSLHGVAAINGGFFTPEGKPLGLVVTNGERRGGITRTSLGSGIFINAEKESLIVRREIYVRAPQQWGKISHLLQTGPMLTEKGSPISGLSKTNSRPRSFIAWDGNHHWAIGYAEPCTLNALSHAISGKAPAGFPIKTAINLDGGRSSDLWVGNKVRGGPKVHRGFFNKPVRNFLVVVPK